jgi:hypothetical protein
MHNVRATGHTSIKMPLIDLASLLLLCLKEVNRNTHPSRPCQQFLFGTLLRSFLIPLGALAA